MNETLLSMGERLPLPDWASRMAVARLVARTDRRLAAPGKDSDRHFAQAMADYPVAIHTGEANAQHYEVPSSFFEAVLGPRLKYSCCLFDRPDTTLAEAEEAALAATAAHAGLADGQTILELGCGWGSLSLWMAEHFPRARILAVSNSHGQRGHIERQATARGLGNLVVQTADMNDFVPAETFDRIVSVEMFEHMANWRALLAKLAPCLAPDGRLFLHVFTHRSAPYRFDHRDKADWIAQHFFTGGIMPSHSLVRAFDDLFSVDAEWRWNGSHYARTAEAWLDNFDGRNADVSAILRETYGADWKLWHRRWRLFFLATAGLFGHDGGNAWGVSHYLLKPSR